MRHSSVRLLLVAGLLLTLGALSTAQAALEGAVTLRGSKTLTGEIKVAQVGVLQGGGIGSLLPDMGSFKLKVADQVVELKAADLASAEVTWALQDSADAQSWKITKIAIVKRDGTTVEGAPTWSVQATSVVVGDNPAVYAFPKAGLDFSADNLLAKIEIAGVSLATPAPLTPPAVETFPPATTPPAVETPPATTPPAVETPPATTPPAVETPAPTTPPVTVAPGQVLGGGTVEYTVICPQCGEKIRITVNTEATPEQ